MNSAVTGTKSSSKIVNSLTKKLFVSLTEAIDSKLTKSTVIAAISSSGISQDDPRLANIFNELSELSDDHLMDYEEFHKIISTNLILVKKCLQSDFVIPDFGSFCHEIKNIYDKTKDINTGTVADYIPQLKRVSPDHYAISLCTVDGQRFSMGDSANKFCLQSACKPINYCLALEENGVNKVHQHIAREPSGVEFNQLSLNQENHPHNPMINAGAIVCCSLIRPDLNIADRFDHVLMSYKLLSGGQEPGFNNSVYLSEKETADRNFALGYFMRENNVFPKGTNLIETLEFYFQCCSIELNTQSMSVVAATLANAGVNPITGERIFSANNVKHCLSLMSSCGMYNFSGEFAFLIGLPAKSGVSGGLMLVVPNVMGIAIWSPPLDKIGNPVRGLAFCEELIKKYNFHNFDCLGAKSNKKDPRLGEQVSRMSNVFSLCTAASYGDLKELKRLVILGSDLNECDYDKRTALHLAAAEGNFNVVKYLVKRNVSVNATDRWGHTPADDAIIAGYKDIADYLVKKSNVK